MILTRGKCKECADDAEKWLYSKKSGLCRYHHQLHKMKTKKPVRLKPISDKQAKRLKEYKVVRDEFLSFNKTCQVNGCKNPATQIHHKAGRIGILLINVSYFLAVCPGCHNIIEQAPMWAKANNYSLNRLNK